MNKAGSMDKIGSLEDIKKFCSTIRSTKKGYLTNFFMDERKHSLWIHKGEFFSVAAQDCIFLIRKTDIVNQLFFISAGIEELSNGLVLISSLLPHPTVIDVIEKLHTSALANVFKSFKFAEYKTLYRMYRLGTPIYTESKDSCVRYATEKDIWTVHNMLLEHFDPLSEQIPCMEEVLALVCQQSVLVYEKDGKVCGFIIFILTSSTSYLRYWFVLPEYRELKIGSKLFNEYMYLSRETKRQMHWVIANNHNAIKRYKHYGFKSENLFDFVLIRK